MVTKHTLSASLRIGEVDLRIVESLRLEHREGDGLWLSAAREPVAVLVKERGATRAYGIDGEPIPIERLRERLPGNVWDAVDIME